MTISHHDEIHKRNEGYFNENSIYERTYTSTSVTDYQLFRYKLCDLMREIHIPHHDGMLCGYFDDDFMQWIYTPDKDFVNYKCYGIKDEQKYIRFCIETLWRLALQRYGNKYLTVDVAIHMNNGDPEYPYSYTVNLKYSCTFSLNYHK